MARLSNHVTDALIAESVRQAEQLLKDLHLDEDEHAWAKAEGTKVFREITDRIFDNDKLLEIRAVCVPAALAFALSMAKDWAAQSDKLRDEMQEPE